jgi:hypothetical protein
MKNIENTKKYLIINLIIFAFSLILFLSLFFLINQKKEEVRVISSDLQIANKEDVVALKRAIRNYEQRADVIEGLLVDKENIFGFIEDVENLAKSEDALISVQNIDLFDVLRNGNLVRNTGSTNPERKHGKFVMSLKIEGSWESVSRFLLKMENYPKQTSVEAVKFNSVFDSQSSRQSWVANFNVITSTN